MSPARTAFIVIHGMGEQDPFETIDPFVQGLAAQLGDPKKDIAVSHRMASRASANGAPWTESFIRIAPTNGDDWVVDVHEYYWAYLTEKKISTAEVFRWVSTALKGTKQYAKENEQLEEKYQNGRRYARKLRKLFRLLQTVYLFIIVARFFLPKWIKPLRWLRSIVDHFGTAVIEGYIGDIAIYTSMDEKSAFYRIRQQILAEARAFVDAVVTGDGAIPYDNIIIAGHSLGSVIAYDTLDRLNIAANLGTVNGIEKIKGLITFGSPLDKIAFYFRVHTKPEQTVRRQILSHLHSFKAKDLDLTKEPFSIADPLTPTLDNIPWVNYFCEKDPVSGHLDFYNIDEKDNVELQLPEKWGMAHIGYWKCGAFYKDVVARYLG